MTPGTDKLPQMPEIGYPEAFYAKRVRQAELANDIHSREAYKVGQYVTLAMDRRLDWDKKLRYFRHALRRHTTAPPLPSDAVWLFYQNLRDLIRLHAGQEALRLSLAEDEIWAARVGLGADRQVIEIEAAEFFKKIMGNDSSCPEHFKEEDWDQLKLVRNQWMPQRQSYYSEPY